MKLGMRHGLSTIKEQVFIIKHIASEANSPYEKRQLIEKIELLEQAIENTIKGRAALLDDKDDIICQDIAVEYSGHHYEKALKILREYGALKADDMEARYLPMIQALSKPTPDPVPNYPAAQAH